MFNPLNEIRDNNLRMETVLSDMDIRARAPKHVIIGDYVRNFLRSIEQYIASNCIDVSEYRYGREITVISGSVYILSEDQLKKLLLDAVAYGRYGDKQYPNLNFSPYSPDNNGDCHVRVP